MPTPARRSRAALGAWWLLALVMASALLVATHFRTRDADSRVYLTIAAHLSEVPMSRWMAPQWWGVWGMQGLYREHPIGTFVPPALLARAGFPALQAAFVVTLAAQIACLLLFVALAARFVPVVEARALSWTLQLMPIAFVFRIRANQEYLLLAGLLAALYGVERSRDRAAWLGMALAGFLYALSVKGLFALIVPVIAIVWLVVMPARPGSRPVRGWVAVGVMLLVTPVAGLLYERAYVATIGDSFLDYYLHLRLSLAGGSSSGATLPFPLDKAWNATWYAGHVAWYAAPWSLALAVAAFTRRTWRWPDRSTRTWILFAVLATAAAIAVASTRDQRSDRYTFPAYFLAGAGGSLVVASWWPRGARWAAALDRYWPWGPAALWLALFAARLALG